MNTQHKHVPRELIFTKFRFVSAGTQLSNKKIGTFQTVTGNLKKKLKNISSDICLIIVSNHNDLTNGNNYSILCY